ncbi:MAG: J domain-containing protein [Spirochaetia bacterium]
MAQRTGGPAAVDPEKALKLFGLQPNATLRDLNTSYRRFVRKYHPDYNSDRKSWAHEAMVKINSAYDSAMDYLASLRYQEIEERLEEEIQAHDRFTGLFAAVANSVLEGVFIYYQYGLENPHIREHGVPRFRYRLALRKIAAGISQLERLQSPNAVDTDTLQVFSSFSIAFMQCMRMSRIQDPSDSRNEKVAYRHYRSGSELLDEVIRKLLFRAELSSPRSVAAPHGIPVCHAEFMKVLIEHGTSSWVTDAAIKSYLLDTVQKLEEIGERVPTLGIGQ